MKQIIKAIVAIWKDRQGNHVAIDTLDALAISLDESFPGLHARVVAEIKALPVFTEPLDDGDLLDKQDFIDCCKARGFVDDDGVGTLVKGDKMSRIQVKPSDLDEIFDWRGATHVMWYNK